MDNKLRLEEMVKHAARISSHLERLKNKPGEVHEMDIDLLTDKLKEMYSFCLDLETAEEIEHDISTINDLSESSEEEIPASASNKGLPIVDTTDERPGEESPPASQEPHPEEIRAKEDPEPDVTEPSQEKAEPALPETDEEKPGPGNHDDENAGPGNEAAREEDKPKTTADLFSGATTIADRFQNKEDKSIAARVAPQGVNDLKKAIGINDKFLFINELFKGDPGVYNKAIDDLNNRNDRSEAMSVMNGYKQEYEWSDNSEAYHRLRKIIVSKYPE